MNESFNKWLKENGLAILADVCAENDIDFDVVTELEDHDLKELGLSLGNRKRLLKAAASLKSPTARNTSQDVHPRVVASVAETSPVTIEQTERRQVAVLFADLTGFTSLSSELDPEELQDVMDEFFRATDGAIATFRGTIDKHLGDGVMAVFGAPISYGDDTLRAVRAASSIHQRLREVSRRVDRSLSAHIGIASGEVLASAGTHDYTVTGDAVNLASRLSDLANADETYVSNDVYQEISRQVLCEEKANLSIKGLGHPVSAWRVRNHQDKPVERNILPFVGRDAERDQFRTIAESVESRAAGAAFIFRGKPGIGKTRLATECLALATGLGFQEHQALVLDFGSSTGSDPLRSIFRSLLSVSKIHDGEALKQQAVHVLASEAFAPDDEAFVFDLLGIPMSQDASAFYRAIENTTRNRRKIEIVGRLMQERSRERPQIILIEDLHWADAITMQFCASLVARCADCPTIIIMTSRIEGDPFDSAWRALTGSAPIYTIDLRALSSTETRQLAEQVDDKNAATLAAEMKTAGGNPLFLEMLIRSSSDNRADALPGTLRSLIQARIDRLSPTDRRAIQAASVIGQQFDLSLLRTLIQEDDYKPTSLVERALVRPMGDQYLFAHALIQQGVYSSITRRNAQAMHLDAASWFDGRDSVLRAEHLARAEHEEAPRAYLRAARELIVKLRFVTTNGLIKKGLQHARDPSDLYELNKALGETSLQSSDFSGAANAYKSAAEFAGDYEQLCVAYLGVATSSRDLSGAALVEASEYLDKMEALCEGRGSLDLRVQLDALRSFVRSSSGDMQGCYESAQLALATAEETQDPELLLKALESSALAHYQVGKFRSVRGLSERVLEIARSVRNLHYEIVGCYQLITAYYYNNLFNKAIEIGSLPAEAGVKYGATRQACLANEYLARVHLSLGQIDKAREHATACLEISQAGKMDIRTSLALIKLSEISMLEGQRDKALEFADAAINCVEAPRLRPWAIAAKARVLTDRDRAANMLRQAEELLSSMNSASHHHFHVRVIQMEVGLRQQDWLAVRQAADRLDNYTRHERLPWTDFHIDRGRVLAQWGRGALDESYKNLLAALRQSRSETGQKVWLPGDATTP